MFQFDQILYILMLGLGVTLNMTSVLQFVRGTTPEQRPRLLIIMVIGDLLLILGVLLLFDVL